MMRTNKACSSFAIMFAALLVSVFLTKVGADEHEFSLLGRAIYLPRYSVLGEQTETGTQVFKPTSLESCTITVPLGTTKESFSSFRDTKAFYRQITTSTGLVVGLETDFSLGFTLDVATKSISGEKRTVNGTKLLIYSFFNQALLNKECQIDKQYLTERYLEDFRKLPAELPGDPMDSGTWQAYEQFLKKYGTHVVTSMKFGSFINQIVAAESSSSYTERDFHVKACLALSNLPTEAGLLNLSVCFGIDQKEINRVSRMKMSAELVLRGGSPATRHALFIKRTKALIEKFLNEANTTHTPVQYGFTSVWSILQSMYSGVDHDNFIRAINLEYFYLGYLNYGCRKLKLGTRVIQSFRLSKDSTPSQPQYVCGMISEGCLDYYDCHLNIRAKCACYGTTCVRYRYDTLDTGEKKPVPYSNADTSWYWHGCAWRGVCKCERGNNPPVNIVWQLNSKDALYMAHRRALAKKRLQSTAETENPKDKLLLCTFVIALFTIV